MWKRIRHTNLKVPWTAGKIQKPISEKCFMSTDHPNRGSFPIKYGPQQTVVEIVNTTVISRYMDRTLWKSMAPNTNAYTFHLVKNRGFVWVLEF